jgi:hypothetical protein
MMLPPPRPMVRVQVSWPDRVRWHTVALLPRDQSLEGIKVALPRQDPGYRLRTVAAFHSFRRALKRA